MRRYLLDSGFLYATLDDSDSHHAAASDVALKVRGRVLLPIPAVTEIAYFLARNKGRKFLADLFADLPKRDLELVAPASEDYVRSAEILRKYSDASIDFVDACIVAMAERLKITKIFTVDRRHFNTFRPTHCDAFEILPE